MQIEPNHPGEHIVSEANGMRSRESDTLAEGQNLQAGTVLGRITSTGLLTQLAPAAETGEEEAVGVLFAAVDASDADTSCVVHVRDCEVDDQDLVWPEGISGPNKETAVGELLALGIIVR
ncbi:head decoration protein [Flagellatimonas centrodinii]|uniref:head decoration protein n=1 Tax=Flagellatimonas centrodinii TaxID=2806210 RepID=UPI001FEDE686|nr:head decoration protein [Flagellatimonas centrodinii]ULQ45965.1 head decoration protein [Flagellatimonas centrodinii]